MKKVVRFLFAELIVVAVGYGVLTAIGWLMNLNIPVPLLIVGFCFLLYQVLRRI